MAALCAEAMDMKGFHTAVWPFHSLKHKCAPSGNLSPNTGERGEQKLQAHMEQLNGEQGCLKQPALANILIPQLCDLHH